MTLHEYPNIEQGSDEWHDARRGIVTASVVGRLITQRHLTAIDYGCPGCGVAFGAACQSLRSGAPIKALHSERAAVAVARRADTPPVLEVADTDDSRGLTAALVAERIAGWTEPSYTNADMLRGILHEPVARDRYAEHNGVEVRTVGFLVRDDWGFPIGASPDGLVGEDGGLEIKCPRAKGHIATVIANEVPAQYMAQIQASLLVTGRDWWDLSSFCAGLPMWTGRVYPDPQWQTVIVAAVAAFEQAAEELTAKYQAHAEGLPATDRIYDDIDLSQVA